MSTHGPAESLFPRTRRLILCELVAADSAGVHLRELARRTGLDPSGVLRELKNLEASGIVLKKRVGAQDHYRLNPDCPVYGELRGLLLKTLGMTEVVRDVLQPLAERVKLAYIYGSFADGTARAESDIDLMVMGDLGLKDLAGPLAKAERALSREVNVTVYSEEEYRSRLSEEDGFVARVHNGPKVILLGDADDLK
jgi:predicted nucleotidyltransferase